MKRRVLTSALVIALSASLAGCSTISSTWNSWFGDDKNKPAALEALSGPATGRIVWSSKGDNINFPLSIATPADRFVVAGSGPWTERIKDASDSPLAQMLTTDSKGTSKERWSLSSGQSVPVHMSSMGLAAAIPLSGSWLSFSQQLAGLVMA